MPKRWQASITLSLIFTSVALNMFTTVFSSFLPLTNLGIMETSTLFLRLYWSKLWFWISNFLILSSNLTTLLAKQLEIKYPLNISHAPVSENIWPVKRPTIIVVINWENICRFVIVHKRAKYRSLRFLSKADFSLYGLYQLKRNITLQRLLTTNQDLCKTKLKCIWNKYANKETMKITSSCGIYKAIYHYVVAYYYLESKNDKVLKFHMKNFPYFEISASFI